jgi:hypothetical protein
MKRAFTTAVETFVLVTILGGAMIFFSFAPELDAAMIAAMGG